MPDGNGDYDWRERMRRVEEAMERNWAEHIHFREDLAALTRDVTSLHTSMKAQKENLDKLLGALRDLIDRSHPKICADCGPNPTRKLVPVPRQR